MKQRKCRKQESKYTTTFSSPTNMHKYKNQLDKVLYLFVLAAEISQQAANGWLYKYAFINQFTHFTKENEKKTHTHTTLKNALTLNPEPSVG